MSALFTTPALVVLGIYTLVVFAILWANHRLHRKPKPDTVRAQCPPPVPPTQADIDATWLAPWPTNLTDQQVDVWLTDELASRMCREILAIEGLSS